ncbi:hypothetical protein [Indibacter alkaliphilus]|nr:hypothetical protein [Indibacter alkaliphilus]
MRHRPKTVSGFTNFPASDSVIRWYRHFTFSEIIWCLRYQMPMMGTQSVYLAIAGEVVNRRLVLLRNFMLKGQESASNLLMDVHAKLCTA